MTTTTGCHLIRFLLSCIIVKTSLIIIKIFLYIQYADTGCLLGASVTIELRKPEVCCLNGNTYNRVIGYSLCDCTIEDYEW